MAPISPPAYQQANLYSAKLDRLMVGALMTGRPPGGPLAPRGGVAPSPSYSLKVWQRTTPDRWVTVSGGTAYVPATSVVGGLYIGWNDGDYSVQTAASHATLNRRDLVVARVYDAVDDVGTDNMFTIEVITGTAASAPVRPATPNQAVPLGEVYVPANSTTVTNANITDLRVFTVASGGIIPVTGNNADIPTSNYVPGQALWHTVNKSLMLCDGAGFQTLPFGSWTAYTPVMTAVTTNPNLGTGSQVEGSYCQVGKTVHVRGNFKVGTSGIAVGSGIYHTSVPVTAKTLGAGGFHFGSASVFDKGGNNLMGGSVRIGNAGYNVLEWVIADTLWTHQFPFALNANTQMGFTITYEAA